MACNANHAAGNVGSRHELRLHADSRRAGRGKADADKEERDEHQRERQGSQAQQPAPEIYRRSMSVAVDHPNQSDHGGESERPAIGTFAEACHQRVTQSRPGNPKMDEQKVGACSDEVEHEDEPPLRYSTPNDGWLRFSIGCAVRNRRRRREARLRWRHPATAAAGATGCFCCAKPRSRFCSFSAPRPTGAG